MLNSALKDEVGFKKCSETKSYQCLLLHSVCLMIRHAWSNYNKQCISQEAGPHSSCPLLQYYGVCSLPGGHLTYKVTFLLCTLIFSFELAIPQHPVCLVSFATCASQLRAIFPFCVANGPPDIFFFSSSNLIPATHGGD